MQSGDPVIKRLGKTVESHKGGILACRCHPITSAVIEGVDNKLKTVIKKTHGYRDMAMPGLLIRPVRRLDPRSP
jgi:transposase